jgi:DNA-binding transcriptional regulator YiaG
MSTENVDLILSPAQCKAARALLGITQPALAEMASLGLSTVVDFEKGRRQVSDAAIRSMQFALQTAGVDLISENGGGPGVRLKKRLSSKARA